MPLRMLISVCVIAVSAIPYSHAQDPDAEAKKYEERVRAREAARLEEQWRGLSPEEIANRKRIDGLLRSSQRHINGKETPELVPYHVRMQMFFHKYQHGFFRQMLQSQLSAGDLAVLDTYAARLGSELEKHAKAYETEWMGIASRAKDMNASEIASAIKVATGKTEALQAAGYRAVLRQLTPAGQKVVSDFAFANVRPQVTTEDPFVIAEGDPKFYKEQIVLYYEMVQRGEQPPPPPGASSPEAQAASSSSLGQIEMGP